MGPLGMAPIRMASQFRCTQLLTHIDIRAGVTCSYDSRKSFRVFGLVQSVLGMFSNGRGFAA